MPLSFPALHFEEAGITPEQILALRPTEAESERFESLIAKKEEGLTAEKEQELAGFISQNEILTSTRLRAMEIIQARG